MIDSAVLGLLAASKAASQELLRLRIVLLPALNGKVGEPRLAIIERLDAAIARVEEERRQYARD